MTRIGFIGAGWWATKNHLPLLSERDDVELAAVCRTGADELRRVQERFGFAFATEDYRELLEQDLEAVFVTTPHDCHYEHARAALERGLHVACEKPLALTAAEAWELVELARERSLHLLVPLGWHYKPFVRRAKELLDAGGVGRVEYALCFMGSATTGFYAGDDAPDEWASELYEIDRGTYQQPAAQGGGHAWGSLVHATALLLWITGLRASEVSARMRAAPGSGADIYNSASVLFDGGAIGDLAGAGTLPSTDKFQIDIRVFGDEGVLLLDLERERLELRRRDGRHERVPIAAGEGAYDCSEPPNRFVDLVLGRPVANESPGEVNARAVELVEAMHRSAADGGKPAVVERRVG